MKHKIYILATILLLSLSLEAQPDGVVTREIAIKNEFFKSLQKEVNNKSAIATTEKLKEARERYPDAVLTWYLSTQHEIHNKDYMKAYEYYLRAKEVSSDPDLDYLAIDILSELGEYDQLTQVYQNLLKAYPYDKGLYTAYMQTLLRLKKYDEYASLVQEIIKLPMINAGYKQHHHNLVRNYIRTKRVKNFNMKEWNELLEYID